MDLTAIKEWATQWKDLVALAGVVVLSWYAWETYRIRLATITQGAPCVRLDIDYRSDRFAVKNLERGIAYNVQCSPFSGATEVEDVDGTLVRVRGTCRFDPVAILPPSDRQSTELTAYMDTGKETELLGPRVFQMLRSASAPMIGLPLQVRYHDGLGFRYAVRVVMPSRMTLDFEIAEPNCSPPVPLTTLGMVKTAVFWRLADTVVRARIHLERWREARAETHAPKRPAQ